MSEIYKICYIVDNKIEKIYVFFGHKHLTDGRHKIEPKVLFKKEPENPVFDHVFSKDEMKNIRENSIDIIFSDEMLHLDDTVETVKKRLKVYFAETAPLIDYYTQAGKLLEMDGEGSVDGVARRIVEALGKECVHPREG